MSKHLTMEPLMTKPFSIVGDTHGDLIDPVMEAKFFDWLADHKQPVIPLSGKWGNTTEWLGYNWNELLPRLWCEANGYQAISKEVHKEKTQHERKLRKL